MPRKREKSECGVTANMPALGAGDSGFESLHSDRLSPGSKKGIIQSMNKIHLKASVIVILGVMTIIIALVIGVLARNKHIEPRVMDDVASSDGF